MTKYFTLDANNKHQGPYTVDELKSMNLKPGDFVWAEGMPQWKKAGDIDELADIFPKSQEQSSSKEQGEPSNIPTPIPTENKGQTNQNTQQNNQTNQQNSNQQQYNWNQHQGHQRYFPWDIYAENFDASQLSSEQINYCKHHKIYDEFPTVAAVLISAFISLFSLIYYGIQFDKLPKLKEDDFGAGKAIGFMFIPFFNFYWVFMFWGKLADRINFQFKLRGAQPAINKSLVNTYCIMTLCLIVAIFIPFINILYIIALIVIHLIMISQVQNALNKLAQENRFNQQQGNYNYQN